MIGEGVVVELLEGVGDAIGVGIAGEEIGDGFAVGGRHGEGDLGEGHAPGVLLAEAVEFPVGKVGVE